MVQNTSSAVMQQRREALDSLDDFPTMPWATRALIEYILFPHMNVFAPDRELKRQKVWEPACNRGHMAKPLSEYFGRVYTSDVHDYGDESIGFCQDRVVDFIFPDSESPVISSGGVDWIITNPPFRLAEQFVERAWSVTGVDGVAIIARTAFLEGVGRYERLFKTSPPSIVGQFTERVPMVKGRLTSKGSTATAYCWLVWMRGIEGTKLVWIPPCRKRLEREGDYPPEKVDVADDDGERGESKQKQCELEILDV